MEEWGGSESGGLDDDGDELREIALGAITSKDREAGPFAFKF